MIPLHALILILMGRFSSRLYVGYSSWYAIGTLASMQVPFVGFQPVRTSEHMGALGVFGLLQLVAFAQLVRSHLSGRQFQTLLTAAVVVAGVGGTLAIVGLTYKGWIAPWTGRFYSLWDTGYAKIHIPIIASVSEHQPTAWPSFFMDLQFLIFLFPAGVALCFRELRDEHVFVIVYAFMGSYFAGVMVRLMLTLTPCVCVAGAVAFSTLLDTYIDPTEPDVDSDKVEAAAKEKDAGKKKDKDEPAAQGALADLVGSVTDGSALRAALTGSAKGGARAKRGVFGLDTRLLVVGNALAMLVFFVHHCTYVTSSAYSSPSVVLASSNPDGSQNIIDDFREAYYWLRQNTPQDAVVMSWWDYGYQIAGFADRATLVDNNTWNNSACAAHLRSWVWERRTG
jgi:dolichyl-diphosphooligosaccharide--protein glycosyltransferase